LVSVFLSPFIHRLSFLWVNLVDSGCNSVRGWKKPNSA